jgi:hypothetical protein
MENTDGNGSKSTMDTVDFQAIVLEKALASTKTMNIRDGAPFETDVFVKANTILRIEHIGTR